MDLSDRWVLKLMGRSDIELAADWIGSLLAQRLAVPCVKVDIASMSAEALQSAPSDIRAWAAAGPAFASEELLNCTPPTSDTAVASASNRQELGKLYALDAWLEVLDRRKPDGTWNLLLETESWRFYAVDFGKCLALPLLGTAVLDPAPCIPKYPEVVRRAADRQLGVMTCQDIDAIDDGELDEIVRSVPPKWLTAPRRHEVVKFLIDRKAVARAAVDEM